LPDTIEEQQQLMEETVFGGAPDIEQRPELWVPFDADVEAASEAAYPLELLRTSEAASARIDRTLSRLGVDESSVGFLPIVSVKNDACVIIDLNTARMLAVLDMNPWIVIK
jgi:hypothetical protein